MKTYVSMTKKQFAKKIHTRCNSWRSFTFYNIHLM